jgi:transposase
MGFNPGSKKSIQGATTMKKTMRPKTKKDKSIRLRDGERIHVGIDVHLEKNVLTLWSATTDYPVVTWTLSADPEAIANTLRPFADHIERIVYEAGPTGFSLARLLREEGFKTDVVSPADIARPPKKNAKSDRLDSRALARLSVHGELYKTVYVPTPVEQDEREFFRARDQLAEKLRRAKQQIKGLLTFHGIEHPPGLKNWTLAAIVQLEQMELSPGLRWHLDCLLKNLALFRQQIKQATEQLNAHIEQSSHAADVAHLRTVPGVGPITSSAFVLELYRPERFADGRAVGQMLGTAPLRRGSGETTHDCGRDEQGNRRLRSLLIEAAWRWIEKDPGAGRMFRQLVARKCMPKRAIVAMARRLGIILWRIWIEQRPYRPMPAPGV